MESTLWCRFFPKRGFYLGRFYWVPLRAEILQNLNEIKQNQTKFTQKSNIKDLKAKQILSKIKQINSTRYL